MKYVVFDIETTGLDTNNDSIVEIGAVLVEGGVVIDTFEELINPGFSIPEFITRINGIDDYTVKDADYPGVVLSRFHTFIKEGEFLVGHNAKRFDYPFIESEFRRNGIRFDGMPCKDTVWLARSKVRRLRSYSLKSLCEHFNIVNKTAHRALSDVMATYELFEELNRM